MPGVYDTGTISVSADGTAVTGTGVLWLDILEGDWLVADGVVALIDEVTDTVDYDNLTLMKGWPGSTLTDAPYQIVKMSWLRYDAALTQAKLKEFLTALDAQGIYWFVEGTDPDPAVGIDGQWALKTNDGSFKLWHKVSGVWVLQIGFADFTEAIQDAQEAADAAAASAALAESFAWLDTLLTSPQHGDLLRYDDADGKWKNYALHGWNAVSIAAGIATPDITSGHDKFQITVDQDVEIQVPTNGSAGDPFAIRIIMSGTHAITWAAGYRGSVPVVSNDDGDETILSGAILDTTPSLTAFVNTAKVIAA